MEYYSYNSGGQRGGFFSSIPAAVKNLIIINVLVYIMCLLRENDMIRLFALFPVTSQFFKPWQVVTHMFMHGGFWHIFFNMYTLFMFGTALERVWGAKKFLLFYFVCGLGAAALHLGVQYGQYVYLMGQVAANAPGAVVDMHNLIATPTVGASGAVYGLLIGYAMLYPDAKMGLIFPPIVLSAKWMVAIFAVIELATGIPSITNVVGGIAHFAHLGGMLIGWLLMLYWKKKHTLYNNYD